jgi:hypothetical protein
MSHWLREGAQIDLLVDRIEELADLIAEGKTDEAYAILREAFPGLQSITFRREIIARRRAGQ